MSENVRVRYLGGPTAIIEYGGLRLLTDPTFDQPGDYPIGNRKLVKTGAPVATPDEVGPIDAVLLSHDQHPDNLDRLGREYLATVPLVLSTRSAQDRLGDPVRALPNWAETVVGAVTVTGVPALHGPDGSEPVVGEVTGFVLTATGQPTVYVSGDNASLEVVRTIASRFPAINVAILFAGGARTPVVDGYLTLTSDQAAEAATLLGVATVVPLHFEGWAHFTEGRDTLDIIPGLHLATPGEWLTL